MFSYTPTMNHFKRIVALSTLLFFCLYHAFGQYTGNAPYCHEGGGIFINEVSNGPAGSLVVQEYVEFVVVGAPSDPGAPVDISGWIIDDNNFPASGAGNAPGHIVFGDCYSNVLPGSIIVVYNADDPNPMLPADDPQDSNGDGIYIIPHTDPCMDACPTNPTISTPLYCPCRNIQFEPQGWYFNLRNAGDIIQVRDVCETLVHGIHWAGVELQQDISDTPVQFSISNDGQSALVMRFAHIVNDDWTNVNNYENVTIVGNETPGLPNNVQNADFIQRLRLGISSCTGVIWDCRDTDAGDLVIPTNAMQTMPPLEICQGDDLDAFSASYGAPDEFEPDANGFNFEYAFILTNTDGPTFTILDFNQSGDFDLSILTVGTYQMWGLSYIQTNGSIPVMDFLSDPDINSIADIQDYLACGYDGDLGTLDQNNTDMILVVTGRPDAFPPSNPPMYCDTSSVGGTIEIDLTVFNEEVNVKTGLPVNWWLDQAATIPIDNPSTFVYDPNQTTTIYANIGAGCLSETISLDLNVQPAPQGLFEIIERPACAGEETGSFNLVVDGGNGPFDFDWSDDSFDGQTALTNVAPGMYRVTITDANGCTDELTLNFSALETPLSISCQVIPINELSDDIAGEISVSIEGGTAPYFLQLDGPIIRSTTLNEPLESSLAVPPGAYFITATDANSCVVTCQLEIAAQDFLRVFVPNAFSPNGDGVNDFLTVQSADADVQQVNTFEVFDRWGNLVYQSANFPLNDPTRGWDGSINGEVPNPGVYVYIAELSIGDGRPVILSGEVLLVK